MKRQQGFTLIELLAVLALSGLLGAVVVPSIFQSIRFTGTQNARVTAVDQIHKASLWFHRDSGMAQQVALPPDESMVLTWTDYSSPQLQSMEGQWLKHCVLYSLQGSDLKRDYYSNYVGDCAGTVTTITIGRYITTAQFSLSGQIITMRLVATPEGGQGLQEERTYKAYLPVTTESPLQ